MSYEKERADTLTGAGCDPGGAVKVSGDLPHGRPQGASAIEGKTWDKIEERQNEIYRSQVTEDRRDLGRSAAGQGMEKEEDSGERQARQRAGDSHQQLSAWRVRLPDDLPQRAGALRSNRPEY